MKDTVLLVKWLDSHWCELLRSHWTTLMQDTLDNIGTSYEHDFTW